MKKIINISLATTILFSTSVMGNTWIETPFWRAPQVTSFEIGLEGKDTLIEECSIYRKAVFNPDGSLTSIALNKGRLERFRKPINPIHLKLKVGPWEKIEKSIKLSTDNSENDKLPLYTQGEAKTGVLLSEVTEVRASAGMNSFLEVSNNQGLPQTAVNFIQDASGRFVLDIEGRDVACDLYEGNGSVSLVAPAYVILSDKGAQDILQFYNQRLLPELTDVVLNKKESPERKAARVGYRTGRILEEEFSSLSFKETEEKLLGIMKNLFHSKTLEPTSRLLKGDNNLYLNFEESAAGEDVLVLVRF